MQKQRSELGRRNFLKAGLAAGAVPGSLTPRRTESLPLQSAQDSPAILNYQPDMKYRRLGDTDISLSVISLGGLVAVASVYHYAIDHGVNLLHIAEGYLGGQAIKTMGEVLKTRRSQVYVALKDNFKTIDGALKSLQTDYVDFIMFNRHSASEAGDKRILEIFDRYKRAGKVRYAGLTSHGDVKAATRAGIESGMYTLTMPALNQPEFEAMDTELQLAQEKRVGIMAMKTMKGIKSRDLQLAYLKKVLAKPGVTTVLKGIGSFDMFDAYLKAATEELTLAEDAALYRHAQLNRRQNCMMCDECKRVCPDQVEVSTILRCKDYYYDQLGDLETALATYRELGPAQRGGEHCSLCRRCEAACPNGIRITEKMAAARHVFARAV